MFTTDCDQFGEYGSAVQISPITSTDVEQILFVETILRSAQYFIVLPDKIAIMRHYWRLLIWHTGTVFTEYWYRAQNLQLLSIVDTANIEGIQNLYPTIIIHYRSKFTFIDEQAHLWP